ncbi:Predicted transcriptional regulator [Candidatus Terasakiella magnetica]|nr:Predicted transcriptional regulator [Candidatus Terasakiella magnetica]
MTEDDGELSQVRRTGKSEAAFRTISEVADDLDVPQHVLRFWEGKFPQVKPLKRGGGRRYYRPDDVALLRRIRDLLYSEGYTIKGVQKLLKDGGVGPGAKDAAAGSPPAAELELSLSIHDPDPPQDGDEVGEDDDDEHEHLPELEAADMREAGERGALKPHIRRELETLLSELEQLRNLLQPR